MQWKHEDVQDLLYLQRLGSPGLVKDGSLTPLDGMLGVLTTDATTDVSVSAFL